ncbi:hypothetical protein LCGC14_2075660, partial [marine sediment metagenome]
TILQSVGRDTATALKKAGQRENPDYPERSVYNPRGRYDDDGKPQPPKLKFKRDTYFGPVLIGRAGASDDLSPEAEIELYTRFDQVVDEAARGAYRQAVLRAVAGEPIGYIRGLKEFYSLTFKVTPDVLIPRGETELLVDAAVDLARKRGGAGKLWDVCTGSGCVAVAAAHHAPGLTVLATDISPAALAVAAKNIRTHGLTERIRTAEADLLALPDELAGEAPFDAITANPPYVSDREYAELPAEVLAEPELALRAGATGLECIERIVRDAPDRLAEGGMLAMEIGAGQADAAYQLLTEGESFEDVRMLKDLAGIDRTVVARRRG